MPGLRKTNIPYATHHWDPLAGCPLPLESEGCANCWARDLHDKRHKAKTAGKKVAEMYCKPFENLQYFPERLEEPLQTKKPAVVFVGSQCDLFHEAVPDEFIDKVFEVANITAPQHTYLFLTKRADRMVKYFQGVIASNPLPEAFDFQPQPQVWLGVTVCNQQEADEKIPLLLQTPAAHRWLSIEPMLGPVDLTHLPNSEGSGYGHIDALSGYWNTDHQAKIDGVILGGESGKNARPMHPDWARSVRDQCAAAGVPFYFKQWGLWSEISYDANNPREPRWPKERWLNLAGGHGFHGERVIKVQRTRAAGRLLDGQIHNALPWQLEATR